MVTIHDQAITYDIYSAPIAVNRRMTDDELLREKFSISPTSRPICPAGGNSDDEERKLVLEHVDCQDFPFDDVLSLENAVKETESRENSEFLAPVIESNENISIERRPIMSEPKRDAYYLSSEIDFAAISHLSAQHNEILDDSAKQHPLMSTFSKLPISNVTSSFRNAKFKHDVRNDVIKPENRKRTSTVQFERKTKRRASSFNEPKETDSTPVDKQSLPPEGFKITRYPIVSRSMSASADTDPGQQIDSRIRQTINHLVAKLRSQEEKMMLARREVQEWRNTAQQTLKAAQIIKSQMEFEKNRANKAEALLSKVSLKNSGDEYILQEPRSQTNIDISEYFANPDENDVELDSFLQIQKFLASTDLYKVPGSDEFNISVANNQVTSSSDDTSACIDSKLSAHDKVRQTLRAKLENSKFSSKPSILRYNEPVKHNPISDLRHNSFSDVMDTITSFVREEKKEIVNRNRIKSGEQIERNDKLTHSRSDPEIYNCGKLF